MDRLNPSLRSARVANCPMHQRQDVLLHGDAMVSQFEYDEVPMGCVFGLNVRNTTCISHFHISNASTLKSSTNVGCYLAFLPG